jgi:hypothetical protein
MKKTTKKTAPKTTRKPKSLNPLQVGNQVLIRTVTCFQVGKIVEETERGFVLTDSAWIANTGRFATLLRTGTFDDRAEVEPFTDPIFVSHGAICDSTLFRGQLPLSQK